MSISLVTAPIAEPITLNDAKLQLGFGPMQDSDRAASQILNEKIRGHIIAARQAVENYLCRPILTQRWLLQLDGFPGVDGTYQRGGFAEIVLPKPPLQSIDFLKYVDTAGAVQQLFMDTTYGVNPANPLYGYQLNQGSETQPSSLIPPFARPWPPTRMVPNNVIVQFRCGYGGPITVSMTNGSAVLNVSPSTPFTFNPDDAPGLVGDAGTNISIPGAGSSGATLVTNVASVVAGVATLAAVASSTVTNVTAWVGLPVPAVITQAIKFLVEHYYENGGASDCEIPRVVKSLLEPYRNFVS